MHIIMRKPANGGGTMQQASGVLISEESEALAIAKRSASLDPANYYYVFRAVAVAQQVPEPVQVNRL